MKLLFFIFFLIIIDFYFYSGISSILSNKLGIAYKIIYWLFCLFIYISIIFFYIKFRNEGHFNMSIIYSSLFFILLISKLFGSIPLIVDDIMRLIKLVFWSFSISENNHDNGRLYFLKKSALYMSSVLFTSLLLGMKWGRYNFKKNFQDIKINNWPNLLDNYKIIHISDLHLGSFNNVKKIEEVVNIINGEEPDLIVFTGDLVNNYYHEAMPYIESLKKLKAKDGKFSILGNHDYGDYTGLDRDSKDWKRNFSKLLEIQKEIGFDLLLNESRVINVGNDNFNLIGVENWGAGNFNKDGDLNLSMKGVDDTLPTILLSHDPSHWTERVINSSYKIDLQLSGHTHGMQFGVELPGFKWSPIKYRYKYWAGIYNVGNKQIYVNRGLGHLGYAGRVGIMPDISIINIKKTV